MNENYYITPAGHELSCGIILTDGSKLLAIKPYHKPKQLDLPKGHREVGESSLDAALREFEEETGLMLPATARPRPLGSHPYTKKKDLELFIYRTSTLPPIQGMKCRSFFTDAKGRKAPEAVGFEYVTLEDPRFYPALQAVLKAVASKL
jgi:8-oxo-dGTP pyrophosphatase MutT (NUDIX family)